MQFVVTIDLNDSAFDPEWDDSGPAPEVSRILSILSEALEENPSLMGEGAVIPLWNINGDRAGRAEVNG